MVVPARPLTAPAAPSLCHKANPPPNERKEEDRGEEHRRRRRPPAAARRLFRRRRRRRRRRIRIRRGVGDLGPPIPRAAERRRRGHRHEHRRGG